MADFAIATDDLERNVFVRSVQMSTANADISMKVRYLMGILDLTIWIAHLNKSLHAENAFLSTSNGKITGVFNVTDSLGLMTSNAPINATISMTNTEHEPASQLYMSTSNAYVHPLLLLLHVRGQSFLIYCFPPTARSLQPSTYSPRITRSVSSHPPSSPAHTPRMAISPSASRHSQTTRHSSCAGRRRMRKRKLRSGKTLWESSFWARAWRWRGS